MDKSRSRYRRALFILIVGLLSIVLQGTFLKLVQPSMLVPNLPLIVVVYLGFNEANRFGALMAFLVGLELDLYSGILLGPWAGTFVVVFTALSIISQRLFVDSLTVVFLATFLSSLVSCLLFVLLSSQFNPTLAGGVSISFLEALISGVCAPLVFLLLQQVLPWRKQLSGSMTQRNRN